MVSCIFWTRAFAPAGAEANRTHKEAVSKRVQKADVAIQLFLQPSLFSYRKTTLLDLIQQTHPLCNIFAGEMEVCLAQKKKSGNLQVVFVVCFDNRERQKVLSRAPGDAGMEAKSPPGPPLESENSL